MSVHKNNQNARRCGVAAAVAGVFAAFGALPAHAASSFEPRIGFDISWIDNVELASQEEQKRDVLVAQARPGIRFMHDGQRVQAYLDYQLQALHFEGTPQKSDQVFHQASLGVQLAAIQEWFYVDVGGERRQSIVDPEQQTNLGNTFQVGNIADETEGHVTPILLHTFSAAEIEASYTQAFVDYSEADDVNVVSANLDDSKNENTSVALRSVAADAFVSWEGSYRRDKVDYDIAQSFDYEMADVQLGFRINPSLHLLTRGGRETDPRNDVSGGGLDASSWHAGIQYRRGERIELRLLTGRRFFGKTYDGLWRYEGRTLDMHVSYFESPTTQTQDRVLRGTTAPIGTPIDSDQFGRLSSDIYLLKRLEGQIGITGRITEVYLALTSERREYFTPANVEDEFRSARIVASRRLGPQMRIEGQAGFTDATLREGDDLKDRTFSISLSRQFGPRATLSLTGNRIERTGSSQPYEVNWIVLAFNTTFGKPGAGAAVRGRGRPLERSRPGLPTVRGYR